MSFWPLLTKIVFEPECGKNVNPQLCYEGQSNLTHQDIGLPRQDLLGHQAPIAGNVHLVHAPFVIKRNCLP